MNNFTGSASIVGPARAFAVVGMTAAIASSQIQWPAYESPIYSVDRLKSSYSAFTFETLKIQPMYATSIFAQEISAFYNVLTQGQEPLGSDFEAVWDANVDKLYES